MKVEIEMEDLKSLARAVDNVNKGMDDILSKLERLISEESKSKDGRDFKNLIEVMKSPEMSEEEAVKKIKETNPRSENDNDWLRWGLMELLEPYSCSMADVGIYTLPQEPIVNGLIFYEIFDVQRRTIDSYFHRSGWEDFLPKPIIVDANKKMCGWYFRRNEMNQFIRAVILEDYDSKFYTGRFKRHARRIRRILEDKYKVFKSRETLDDTTKLMLDRLVDSMSESVPDYNGQFISMESLVTVLYGTAHPSYYTDELEEIETCPDFPNNRNLNAKYVYDRFYSADDVRQYFADTLLGHIAGTNSISRQFKKNLEGELANMLTDIALSNAVSS